MSGLSRVFPKSQTLNAYHMGGVDECEEGYIDCLVGAFMFVRRETIRDVGFLDEQFFMYGEDIDWCYRMKQAGWDIAYMPETTIIHLKGASNRRKSEKVLFEFYRSMMLFYDKHFEGQYPHWQTTMIYFAIWLRYQSAKIMNKAKS